jgi:hypothetical protein
MASIKLGSHGDQAPEGSSQSRGAAGTSTPPSKKKRWQPPAVISPSTELASAAKNNMPGGDFTTPMFGRSYGPAS